MKMKRTLALFLVLLLLALAAPLEGLLRASAPVRPASSSIGVGRLLGSVLTGAFRPLLLTYLYLRADTLDGQGRYDELYRHYRTMLALYPDNPAARGYFGWHMAFNLKREMPDRDLAWRWAREGLDILASTPRGRRQLAYWSLAQCGQSSLDQTYPLRYAGREWEDEVWWREKFRAWGTRSLGVDSDRFGLGLDLLEGQTGVFDLAWRSVLAERMAYDRFARTGRCEDFDRVESAMRDYARAVADHPEFALAIQTGLELLRSVRDRKPRPVPLRPFPRAYRVAMAVLGIGIAEDDADLRRAAALALQRLDAELDPDEENFAEEIARAVG